MAHRDIVVVGASAGGVEALSEFVRTLPCDLPAAVFVVLHIPAHSPSRLPEILNRVSRVEVVHPTDGDRIKPGRIYVAPPDRHLLLESDHILVKNGPKENRFRPSVDALFRSAAYVFGTRVIGVILTGALDDGTSGLWSIKRRGGLSIIQDPEEAQFPDMPKNALDHVKIDYTSSIATMGELLGGLVEKEAPKPSKLSIGERKRLELEICIATKNNAFERGIMEMGELAPFTCPECHGALVRLIEGDRVRFRCHTGHAYTANSLLADLTEANEEKLWQAMRGFEEAAMLLEHLGLHFKKAGDIEASKLFYTKARETKDRARVIHDSVLSTESLSEDIRHEGTMANDGGSRRRKL